MQDAYERVKKEINETECQFHIDDYVFEGNYNFEQYILNILEHLDDLPKESKRVYVSGEWDSQQTDFEYISNQLRIGVIADSDTAGYSLLRILRYIVDDNLSLMDRDVLDEEKGPWSFTRGELVSKIKNKETMYGSSFPNQQGFAIKKLCGSDGEYEIKRSFEDMDLWDIKRFRKYILNRDLRI